MPTQGLSSPIPMSEDQFQKAVLQLAQLNGYEIRYHNPDSRRSQAGFPDLVLASQTRARFLLRELKTDTGRVSGIQKFTIGVLTACGIDVAVWRPADLRSGAILADLRGGRR